MPSTRSQKFELGLFELFDGAASAVSDSSTTKVTSDRCRARKTRGRGMMSVVDACWMGEPLVYEHRPPARKRGSGVALRRSGSPPAVAHMIVHHAHGLHERIADGRADEGEAATPEVLAHRVALRRAGGDL